MFFGRHFCFSEDICLLILILKILCGAVLGYGCGIAAREWTKRLLQTRGLEYSLSTRAEQLLRGAALILGGVIGGVTGSVPAMLCGLLLLTVCLTLSVTDWLHRVIPNPTALAVLILGVVFGVPSLLGVRGFPEFHLVRSLIGFAACFVIFSLPGFFGKNVGAGDIKLAAAMGFFLGIYGALIAVVIMGVMVLAYTVAQKRMPVLTFFKSYIPMGPFLAVGMLAAYLAAPVLSAPAI